MDAFDALDRARSELERRLDAIGAEQWDRPTPCSDWTVRELVAHLTGGAQMAVVLLDGASRDDAVAQVRAWHVPGADGEAVAAFRVAADAQDAALRAPGALERTCHHPAGDVPGAQLLRFRIGDMTVHSWDLARAIGADEGLDAELVEDVYTSMLPMAPFIATVGVFGSGPSGTVADAAPAQQRLLDLSGRRP